MTTLLKKGWTVFILLLVLLVPVNQVLAQRSSEFERLEERTEDIPEDFEEQFEIIGEQVEDRFEDGVLGQPGVIGEDIILNVVDYQPDFIRSSLLEDSSIYVTALLQGQPTNPTITVPRINNVVIRRQRVTTLPEGAPVSIGRVRHISPGRGQLSFDNMGYMVVPIRQIPRENDVPDELVIDVDARVFFDVSEGLTFGPTKDVLVEQNHNEWLSSREDHSFYAGYIRVSEIKGSEATIVLYDNSLNEVRGSPMRLRVGQSSRSLSARGDLGYTRTGRIFDQFTIKLDRITSLSDKVRLLLNQNGQASEVTLSEGEFLYPGSTWFVDNIIPDTGNGEFKVRLRNRNSAGVFFGSIASSKNRVELVAKKLDIEPSVTTKQSPSFPGLATDPSAKDYSAIKEAYDELTADPTAEDALGYVDYTNIVQSLMTLHPVASIETKSKTVNLLRTIERYYNEKRVEYELAQNLGTPTVPLIDPSIIAKADDLRIEREQLEQGSLSLPTATRTGSGAASFAYQQAKQEYQALIERFALSSDLESRKKVADAHWRIANMPPSIVTKESRLYHLNTLLNHFKDVPFNGFNENNIKDLIRLLETLESDYQSASVEMTEPATGEKFSVVLAGAVAAPESLKSKATLTLDGSRTNTYLEGEQLLWPESDDEGAIIWQISEINDNSLVLSRTDGSAPQTVFLDREISIQVKDGAGNKRKVKLVDTEVQKEARVTISPVVERAFSEAIFTLHLPIEKRALDLPLFSDTVEEEIAKTEELLEELEEILANVRKITEYWQKFCLITFGALWAKNLVFGLLGDGQETEARQRVGDMFKERHQQCVGLPRSDPNSCATLSYDQYVFANEKEYEDAIAQSEKIVKGIQTLDYSKNFPQLGPEYNSDKEELYYYDEMRKFKPGDLSINQKYYAAESNLKKAEIERAFAGEYFSTDGSILDTTTLGQAKVDQALGSTRMQEVVTRLGQEATGEERIKFLEYADRNQHTLEEQNQYLWDTYNERLIPHVREQENKEKLTIYIDDLEQQGVANTYISLLKATHRVDETDVTSLEGFKHDPSLAFGTGGRQKDKVRYISVDAHHYVEVSYTTGGRVEQYNLFRRTIPNGPMGVETDVNRGVVDEQILATFRQNTEYNELGNKLDSVRSCIGKINQQNSKNRYSRGSNVQTKPIGCGSVLGSYAVKSAPSVTGPSCTDYMSPDDCKLLFNACDPVICPPSRCNLGGNWHVDNVVETGLIGSAALCLPNFGIDAIGLGKPGGVVMPICLTGIHAGLQNIHSIVQGYHQCLVTAKVTGRAVGICDRIRSFGICEILWKEGIAIKGAIEQGALGGLLGDIVGVDSGGSEYSSFQKSFDNSIETLEFFTQDYAKNTFARYSGGSLPEIGTEICKAAIFRKAPGLGNFFEEITTPESPPQFNAFFDEAPYSDIGPETLSQYKIFYHIYAGESAGPAPTIYSVWLQSKDPFTNEFIQSPVFVRDSRGIARGRRLPPGGFASEAPDMILPAGMQEICVEISTDVYGRKVECGFGKVTTEFALNYLSDQFTQAQLSKSINSAEDCISEQSAIGPKVLAGELGAIATNAVGTVSSGFVNTGIVRKCSEISPGVGVNEEDWSPVGSCGADKLGRDLGTCWLYLPASKNLIKHVGERTEFTNTLNETALKVIQEAEKAGSPIPGFETLTEAETDSLLDQANTARNTAKANKDVKLLEKAREIYNQILDAYTITEPTEAIAQYNLAQTYEEEARIILEKIPPATPPQAPPQTQPQSPTAPASPSQQTTTQSSCIIINHNWGNAANQPFKAVTQARDGEEVTINLDTRLCQGESFDVTIYEKDTVFTFGNEVVDEFSFPPVNSDVVRIPWTAEWTSDGLFQGNPEFIYEISLNGQRLVEGSDAKELEVEQSNEQLPPYPLIQSVSPLTLPIDETTKVTITGRNFEEGVEVFFPIQTLPDLMYLLKEEDVRRVSDSEIEVLISTHTLFEGLSYNLLVRNKDGETSDTIALTIVSPEEPLEISAEYIIYLPESPTVKFLDEQAISRAILEQFKDGSGNIDWDGIKQIVNENSYNHLRATVLGKQIVVTPERWDSLYDQGKHFEVVGSQN